MSAERFVERLEARRSPGQAEKHLRYFKTGAGQYGEGDVFIGVPMGRVFALAKESIAMPPDEIERLLESPIRQGDVADTFAIAEMLLDDGHDLIHKATGGWLRAAGARDRPRLLSFLDAHATTMPRTLLRYAIEHLDEDERSHYLGARTAGSGRAAG